MHLTLVNTVSCMLGSYANTFDVLGRYRLNGYRLLHQPIKQHSSRQGGPTIKSKGELIQVVIEIRWPDGSLMSAHKPALGQGSDSVGEWQQVLTDVCFLFDHLMVVSQRFQSPVSV